METYKVIAHFCEKNPNGDDEMKPATEYEAFDNSIRGGLIRKSILIWSVTLFLKVFTETTEIGTNVIGYSFRRFLQLNHNWNNLTV